MWSLVLILAFADNIFSLKCYEGTLEGINNNSRTEEKHCSGISNYCIQKIDKKNNQIRRECSSFSDEHNMEEKCPMTGCHWQSPYETFCCCQFDGCNEWKADGTEYKKGETVPMKSFTESQPSGRGIVEGNAKFLNTPKTSVRTPSNWKEEVVLD